MGTTLTPAPQSSSQYLYMALSGARLEAGSQQGGAALYMVSLTIGQGCVSVRHKSPSLMAEICTLNMCVFVLWNLRFLIY